ncbi:alpha/beta family hydrolase, partial [Sinorhizobium meliloti]|uniref:alpha/beta family hydrolase n=1 Tax=Rhizobium meliloti TaxID=382 RepID=UPI000FE046BD
DEVSRYAFSDRIERLWLEYGDHDLKPRKTVSGFSTADHLKTLAEAVARWADRLAP